LPYLRIRLASEGQIPPLQQVIGLFEAREYVKVPDRWFTAALERLPDETGYTFHTGASHYLHQLKIRSAIANSLGELSFYGLQNGRWQKNTETTISGFEHETTRQSEALISLKPMASNHWRLLFSAQSTGYLSVMPVVEYAWQAKQMVFVRQGQGPFTLAYGVPDEIRQDIRWPVWQNHPQFPDDQYQSTKVILGNVGEHEVSLPPQDDALGWWTPAHRNVLFWLGAICFVLIMLALVMYLYREISNGKDKEGQGPDSQA
jgi:hypothetical protein